MLCVLYINTVVTELQQQNSLASGFATDQPTTASGNEAGISDPLIQPAAITDSLMVWSEAQGTATQLQRDDQSVRAPLRWHAFAAVVSPSCRCVLCELLRCARQRGANDGMLSTASLTAIGSVDTSVRDHPWPMVVCPKARR